MINLRIKDLELKPHSNGKDYEIVKWQGETHYVVAFLREHKEGYDLVSVSDRPFKEDSFWRFAEICYEAVMMVWRYKRYEEWGA